MRTKKIVALVSLIVPCGASFATEHWTAEIQKLTVLESTAAWIMVSNPRNGPSGTFPCTQNVVYVGVKDTPVKKELLAQAMMVYAGGKTIRFGIRGTGNACESEYITAE